MPGFIEDYLELNKHYESPTSFWKWSAYVSIASVLRDNSYMPDGYSKLYPNIYVLFLAGSAARKNRPVVFSEEFVKAVNNTKTISGRSSIQAIVDELSHTETNTKTGKLMKAGSAIFYAPELSAGIVEDPAAVAIMTDLYDGKTDFTHRLRSAPKFRIDKIVFSALMASNEHMIQGVFDKKATYGGLLGRTFLVVPDEVRAPNSLRKFVPDKALYDRCLDKLKMIATLNGEFIFDEQAGEFYDDWYHPFYKNVIAKGDKGGVTGRVHTGVKKLAMLFAANDGKMEISFDHVKRAIDECTGLIPNYNKLLLSAGKSTMSEASTIILLDILAGDKHRTSRREILSKNWNNIDAETFDKCILTLEGGGLLETTMIGSELGYKLTPKCVEILTSKGEGK